MKLKNPKNPMKSIGTEISRSTSAIRRKQMAHKPGNEYQIRIVREDGTEELSG
jgi:hypothetical protein